MRYHAVNLDVFLMKGRRAKEKSWGFGPGANEAGIRLYPLSEKIANQNTK